MELVFWLAFGGILYEGSVAELALAAISIFWLRQIRQSSAYFKPSMPPLFSFGSREI